MTVKFLNETFSCKKAEKLGDRATLYREDGGKVEFKGVLDWSVFSVDGGEWSTPEPSREEKLEARVKALTETNAMLEECIVEMAAVVYA